MRKEEQNKGYYNPKEEREQKELKDFEEEGDGNE